MTNEAEEILNNQVRVISERSELRSDVVLYLLRQGWSYNQTLGKPDSWVKPGPQKFTISKDALTTNYPDMISVIRQEIVDAMKENRKEE